MAEPSPPPFSRAFQSMEQGCKQDEGGDFKDMAPTTSAARTPLAE